MFFAAPFFFFWFIGLQLKQFALHKCYDKTLWIFKSLSLFCLYSTKRARNTRRSTALGKKPLLFGIVPDTQNHPIPLWIQFLLGVAVARREEVCIVMYPVSLWSTRLLHAQFNSCFLPLCWVFPTVSRELVAWRESKFWKGGVRFFFFFFWSSKVFFCCDQQQSKTEKIQKQKRESSSGGHRVWTEERSMVYIAQCNCHMKVKLCSFTFSSEKLADHTDCWAS